MEYNVTKLKDSGQPIATIKGVHTGANAAKASPEDASGLEAVVCLAKSACVMLISYLWVEVGLVNGAMGTIEAICYRNGGPPDLPIAVMVKFDQYTGPSVHAGIVPITPIRRTWSNSGVQSSRLQLPLKLAWAVTIHKSQGLTLNKVVVDIGKKEFSCGLTFVACSRVRHITDILFTPLLTYQRLANLSNSQCLHERQLEDQRLQAMQPTMPETLQDALTLSTPNSLIVYSDTPLLPTPHSTPAPVVISYMDADTPSQLTTNFPCIDEDTPSLPTPDIPCIGEGTPSNIPYVVEGTLALPAPSTLYMDEDTPSPPTPGIPCMDEDIPAVETTL